MQAPPSPPPSPSSSFGKRAKNFWKTEDDRDEDELKVRQADREKRRELAKKSFFMWSREETRAIPFDELRDEQTRVLVIPNLI